MTETAEIIPGLVSVVIGTLNSWPDVEMTIESALHQSHQPIEVIVVDNSSTDATPEEVPRRFGQRVRFIRQPNRGAAGQRNTGFAVARGEFIQFADGDDVLAPNKLAKQVEVFRANPELDIVYGDIRRFQTAPDRANWTDETSPVGEDMLKMLLEPTEKPVGVPVHGALFHRRALERVGPWDETLYCEDYDYWLRAAWAGCRFGHCPGSIMGFYRIRADQKSANVSAMRQGREAVWDKALGYVTREPYRSLIAAQLAGVRFFIAVSNGNLTKRDALAKLALARATSPETVSSLAYVMGWSKIVVPGMSALVRLPWLGGMRRTLGRLLHPRIRG